VSERVVVPAPPLELQRPRKCQYNHNEIEDQNGSPDNGKILGRSYVSDRVGDGTAALTP
jgi:hypothetical protein